MRNRKIFTSIPLVVIISGIFMARITCSLLGQENDPIDSILLGHIKAPELAQLRSLPISSVAELTGRLNAATANDVKTDRLFQFLAFKTTQFESQLSVETKNAAIAALRSKVGMDSEFREPFVRYLETPATSPLRKEPPNTILKHVPEPKPLVLDGRRVWPPATNQPERNSPKDSAIRDKGSPPPSPSEVLSQSADHKAERGYLFPWLWVTSVVAGLAAWLVLKSRIGKK